ncbi:MAG: bifunctional pyr operon transcriptional regulator/uracil phosphoribosyltransferase PyrR [Vampirovibrionales bacterium]|nr:bifunctional pyr operon transcriptional regulator/uracil phosphoribosyltransferase PyrR [Vampirovibrionales bacterium]
MILFDESDIARTLARLAHEILESNHGGDHLALMGIVTRGRYLAERLAAQIGAIEGKAIPCGYLDITLYRDDVGRQFRPVGESEAPCDLSGMRVILVDDVLHSGRTVRAALDALSAYGRPASVQLAVLLDRGERQLPIAPDFVGKVAPAAQGERVVVRLRETDGCEQVSVEQHAASRSVGA